MPGCLVNHYSSPGRNNSFPDSLSRNGSVKRALIEFGRETDCKIVAEGVESEDEMTTLRHLGVHAAQGYLLSHPVSLEDLRRLVSGDAPGPASFDAPGSVAESIARRWLT